MNRQYFTNHQGIAAYAVLSGCELLSAEPSRNKNNMPCTKFIFDVDPQAGRRLGDEYYNGEAVGNLKDFATAMQTVKQAAWKAKQSDETT